MKFVFNTSLFCLLASQSGAAAVAAACSTAAQDATVYAITYAYPLAAFQRITNTVLARLGAPNSLLPLRELDGPADQEVVRPNADTLYTEMTIDLSHEDLIFTVPEINDGRFWVFPFYDFFGNNFAILSITNKAPPGQYLVRRAADALVEPGVTFTKAADKSSYKGYVNFPTTYGTLISRILVEKNNTQDLNKVHAYQDATGVATTRRQTKQSNTLQAPALTAALLNTSSAPDTYTGILELLAKLGPYNQPEVLSDSYNIASILGQAGLANGAYCPPAGVNLTAAITTANTAIQTTYYSARNIEQLGNGWSISTKACSGNFGTNYACRAFIAIYGYLQLVQSQAIYPSRANATTTLGPKQAILLTFSAKPPLKSSGFWSLTAYNAAQFLIPNSLNRYEIGDRTTGLKYENGGLVNGNGKDGPFQVLLQPADVTPPSNWTSNWLPAPAGGGAFSYTLRFYAASAALTNGSYVYPTVEIIDAITA